MVAISLYRGNLHRVPPDTPRRWLMPPPAISLRDFRTLLRKRTKALSKLSRSRFPPPPSSTATGAGEENVGSEGQRLQTEIPTADPGAETPSGPAGTAAVTADSQLLKPKEDELISAGGEGAHVETGYVTGSGDLPEEKVAAPLQVKAEPIENSDVPDENEKKKKELEEKLHILNEKKHKLVQALKQILNAEEEMKKRNSMQTAGVRDLEGESHLQQMHITSPSAASPLRRTGSSPFQHNTAPLTNRVNYSAPGQGPAISNTFTGVTASPSRFAPPGHQGHPSSLLSVSVSGTHYAASSPSPAASGGTSAFRDGRLTSPSWN